MSPQQRQKAPHVEWRPSVHLPGVALMSAKNFSSDIAFYYDSFDFCLMYSIEGDRGPRNSYRRWSYAARPGDVMCPDVW